MNLYLQNIPRKTTSFYLAIIILWGLTSCSKVTTAAKDSTNANDPRVIYKERHFKTKLAVIELKQRELGGLLQASATLKNKWRMGLRFQYQFRFFDSQGFPIEQDSRPWTPILITGGDSVNVTATSPNTSAETFTIVIQR